MTAIIKSQNFKKIAISLLTFGGLAVLFFLPQLAGAQTNDLFGVRFGEETGLGARDPRETVALIIRIFMGFLGTIAIIIILLGGFKWMTAAGNEEKVSEAKRLLGAGIIGLVIILSAFAITTFVLNQLINVTNAG